MRYFALFALVVATVLKMSAADVDAAEKTTVSVSSCSDYDPDDCGTGGCTCEKTRDGNYASYSRWSCPGDSCTVCYDFTTPQDINDLGIAFYKGSERQRTFTVKLDNTNDDTDFQFTSSGTTDGMEFYSLGSDETEELCIEAEDLDDSEWFSITEALFMVDE